MQFKPPGEQSSKKTFWDSLNYCPSQKVVIVTTERYMFKNKCYSFDFNYLY